MPNKIWRFNWLHLWVSHLALSRWLPTVYSFGKTISNITLYTWIFHSHTILQQSLNLYSQLRQYRGIEIPKSIWRVPSVRKALLNQQVRAKDAFTHGLAKTIPKQLGLSWQRAWHSMRLFTPATPPISKAAKSTVSIVQWGTKKILSSTGVQISGKYFFLRQEVLCCYLPISSISFAIFVFICSFSSNEVGWTFLRLTQNESEKIN